MKRGRRWTTLWLVLAALLSGACARGVVKPGSSGLISDFDRFWETLDRTYPYFIVKGVDWAMLRDTYRPLASQAGSQEELVEVLVTMAGHMRDLHVFFRAPDGSVRATDQPTAFVNWDAESWRTRMRGAGWTQVAPNLGYARVDGIPHIMFGAWSPTQFDASQVDSVLEMFRDEPALIIDVRPNGGGADGLALEGGGIPPDLAVAMTRSDIAEGRDPVLERAVALLTEADVSPSGAQASDGARRPMERWRVSAPGAVRATPGVADGRVLAGWTDGTVRALDVQDGRVLWEFRAPAAVVTTPAVGRERIVFVDRGNTIYGLDPQGRERWRRTTGPDLPRSWGLEGWDYHGSSPVIEDGVVYVGGGDGFVYALREADGTVLWQAQTGGRIRSTPAVGGEAVVVGSADGRVYAFARGDGRVLWETPLDGASLDASAWGFDRTLVQGLLIGGGRAFVGSRDGGLYALRLEDGVIEWRHRDVADSTAWVVGPPALSVDGDALLFGRTGSASVYRVQAATGAELWRLGVRGGVYGSPLRSGDETVVADAGGWLTAVDRSGKPVWSLRVGSGIFGGPAPAGPGSGGVIVGTDDGDLVAYDVVPGPTPRRAVYFDEARLPWSTIGHSSRERAMVEYLAGYGFEPVGRGALRAFLEAAVADGGPSVVVFGMDDLPPELLGPDGQDGLLVRYLESGGKVIWTGMPPTALERAPATGRILGVDRAAPGRLLGVPFDSATIDVYAYEPTERGRAWGLDRGGVAGMGVPLVSMINPLLVDERGRAVAWQRAYGAGRGTGFVFLPTGLAVARPDLVVRVAEVGLSKSLR